MILQFYVYLLIAVTSIYCSEDIIYNGYMKIVNIDENFTQIKCQMKNLEKFKVPARKLDIKHDVRFKNCKISKNYKISKIMKNLRINATALTIENPESLKPFNLDGLKSLHQLTISKYSGKWHPDLLKDLPNLELLRMDYLDIDSKLPINFFKYCGKLKKLEILNAYIQKLRKKQFDGLVNLTHLKLNVGFIMEVEDGFAFDSLTSLESLTITHQTLYILPADSFKFNKFEKYSCILR